MLFSSATNCTYRECFWLWLSSKNKHDIENVDPNIISTSQVEWKNWCIFPCRVYWLGAAVRSRLAATSLWMTSAGWLHNIPQLTHGVIAAGGGSSMADGCSLPNGLMRGPWQEKSLHDGRNPIYACVSLSASAPFITTQSIVNQRWSSLNHFTINQLHHYSTNHHHHLSRIIHHHSSPWYVAHPPLDQSSSTIITPGIMPYKSLFTLIMVQIPV